MRVSAKKKHTMGIMRGNCGEVEGGGGLEDGGQR